MLRTDFTQRIAAAAVAGGGVVIAIALVWLFRPPPERTFEDAADAGAPARSVANASIAVPAAEAPAPTLASIVQRAPLPGEAPGTPMAQALADLSTAKPRSGAGERVAAQLEGEREFGAEPVDATWAPGAETNLLAKIAQAPGLELIDLQVHCRSTMCQLQLTQPRRIAGEAAGPPFLSLLDSLGMEPRWMMTVPRRFGRSIRADEVVRLPVARRVRSGPQHGQHE